MVLILFSSIYQILGEDEQCTKSSQCGISPFSKPGGQWNILSITLQFDMQFLVNLYALGHFREIFELNEVINQIFVTSFLETIAWWGTRLCQVRKTTYFITLLKILPLILLKHPLSWRFSDRRRSRYQ